jgi:hypothetical protein
VVEASGRGDGAEHRLPVEQAAERSQELLRALDGS